MRNILLLAMLLFAQSVTARALRDCEELNGEGIYECLGATEKGRRLFLKELLETGKKDDTAFRDLPPLASQLNYTEAIPVLRLILSNARNLP